jgi:activator of HSP90 ATPase
MGFAVGGEVAGRFRGASNARTTTMLRVIEQSVVLPAIASLLYDMYLDPEQHAAFTGAPVKIAAKVGASFSAFDGALSGKILQLVPKQLIVQSWRSTEWRPDDVDSTLVLRFSDEASKGRIDLTHVNVADSDYDGVREGWKKYYWDPWRAYLEKS